MTTPSPGTIILLNGVGSAGKTSIARAIQEVFDEPYCLIGMDAFLIDINPNEYTWRVHPEQGFQVKIVEGANPPESLIISGPYGHLLMSGLHHTVATLARLGLNVVLDHVLWEPKWLPCALGAKVAARMCGSVAGIDGVVCGGALPTGDRRATIVCATGSECFSESCPPVAVQARAHPWQL
jgi:chloramphenicol 3-O-phosphotransferase